MNFKCGGISIIGKHEKNQDRFVCQRFEWGYVAVVSDGLGSLSSSEIGSNAICEAVVEISDKYSGKIDSMNDFLTEIHSGWLERLSNYNIEECSATCLFCVINVNTLSAVQLGDGFIGVVNKTGATVLLDDKSEHFVNETDSLCEIFQPELWRTLSLNADDLLAVVLSTDGISIGNGTADEIQEFCNDFYDGYKDENSDEIENDITGWLSDWHGGDDKTIAFIMRNANE